MSYYYMPKASNTLEELYAALDLYKDSDGKYVPPFYLGDPKTCSDHHHWASEDPESMIFSMLGFCHCGQPWFVLEAIDTFLGVLCERAYVIDTGKFLDGTTDDTGAAWTAFEEYQKTPERTFMFYWAASVGLTTHIGTVNGSCFPELKAYELYSIVRTVRLINRQELPEFGAGAQQ